MAKQFTMVQSITSITDAIKAICEGKPKEECLALALNVVNIVPNSNSMIVAQKTDEMIAQEGLELDENQPAGDVATAIGNIQSHINAMQTDTTKDNTTNVEAPALPAEKDNIPF